MRATDYDPIPSGAYDLNIDLVPTSGNSNSLWGPALQQVIYARAVTTNWNQLNTADAYTTADYTQSVSYACPTEAKKLQSWTDPEEFDNYVDSLTPSGNTYHDIGLLWGARFTSATGIFASENAYTPQGGEIQRNIIFMTDGDACTSTTNYSAYGVPWFDRRQTSASSVAHRRLHRHRHADAAGQLPHRRPVHCDQEQEHRAVGDRVRRPGDDDRGPAVELRDDQPLFQGDQRGHAADAHSRLSPIRFRCSG